MVPSLIRLIPDLEHPAFYTLGARRFSMLLFSGIVGTILEVPKHSKTRKSPWVFHSRNDTASILPHSSISLLSSCRPCNSNSINDWFEYSSAGETGLLYYLSRKLFERLVVYMYPLAFRQIIVFRGWNGRFDRLRIRPNLLITMQTEFYACFSIMNVDRGPHPLKKHLDGEGRDGVNLEVEKKP